MESSESNFHRGIDNILDHWTALQLAVDQGFGGIDSREKAIWLADVVEQWFQENSGIEPYELGDFLAEILSNEFELIIDDGSLGPISERVCECYSLCQRGKLTELESMLAQLPKVNLDQCQAQPDQEEVIEDGEEDMEAETTHVAQVPNTSCSHTTSDSSARQNQLNGEKEADTKEEDDGWTVVKKGKKR